MIETVNIRSLVATKTARLVASKLLFSSATTACGLAPLATISAARFLLHRSTLGGTTILRRNLKLGRPKRASTLVVGGPVVGGVATEAGEAELDSHQHNPEASVVNGKSLYPAGLRAYHSVSDIGIGLDPLKHTTIMKPSDAPSVSFGKPSAASNTWESGNPIRFAPTSPPTEPSPNENHHPAPHHNTWEMGNPIRFSPPSLGHSKTAPSNLPSANLFASKSDSSTTTTGLVPKPETALISINDSIPSPLYHFTSTPGATSWSHLLYKAPRSQTLPPVRVCTTASQIDTWAQRFLPSQHTKPHQNPYNIISLDLEWTLMAGTDARKTISVVQLAKEDLICIFHLGSLPEGFSMPPVLKKVLEDERIIKCGVCIQGDASRLQRFLGVNVKGVLELSHFHHIVKHSEELVAELEEAAAAEAAAAKKKKAAKEALAKTAAKVEAAAKVTEDGEKMEVVEDDPEAEATAADIAEKEGTDDCIKSDADENEVAAAEKDEKKKKVKKVKEKEKKISKKLVSLARLVEEYMGMPLDKGPVRCEPWHRKLREEQVKYAAADAYAGVKLYEEMQRRRHAFDCVPEMPEVIHYLDDGTKALTKWGLFLPAELPEKKSEDTAAKVDRTDDKTAITTTDKTTSTKAEKRERAISISSTSSAEDDPYSPLPDPSDTAPPALPSAPPAPSGPSASTTPLPTLAKIANSWADAYLRRLEKFPTQQPSIKVKHDSKLWLICYALFQRHGCCAKDICEVLWPNERAGAVLALPVNVAPLGRRPDDAEEKVMGWISMVGLVEGLDVDRARMVAELSARG